MQEAFFCCFFFSETNGSVHDTEAAMRGDESVVEAFLKKKFIFFYFFFLNGYSFGNLTVVSSRMELNFEPNSSVLSCATVRGEKKQTEKTQRSDESRRKQCLERLWLLDC